VKILHKQPTHSVLQNPTPNDEDDNGESEETVLLRITLAITSQSSSRNQVSIPSHVVRLDCLISSESALKRVEVKAGRARLVEDVG
jgi:hypothetical protein